MTSLDAPTTAAPNIDTPTLLTGLLGPQRRIVGVLAGLDHTAMHRSVLPSGWSFAGMVQHLTQMTTFWFDVVMSGDPYEPLADDFAVERAARPAELLERYTVVTERGHDRVRALPLATPPAWWPSDLFGPWRLHSLFEVLQHVLVETSTHSGHLDAARELHDGRGWRYPEGRLSE
jgi:uncharacterized damage-inducible protein DinB